MNARLSRNLALNLAGILLPVIVSMVTVPFYIHAIGAARYGIVSITWILLGYFGFLDFGLSRASANALGKLAHAPPEARAPVLITALYLNVLFGLAASFLLYLGGSSLMSHVFSLPSDLRQETLDAFPWIVPMLPLGMVIGVAMGALESRERFLLSNLLSGSGMVLGQILPLFCVFKFGPSLGVVIPALLLVRLLVAVTILGVVARLEWPIRSLAFDFGWARKLFSYGAWVTVSSLIGPALDTFDQLFIGHTLGPAAVAHYSVPMNIALRSQMLATALARTLFPRISREDAATGQRLATNATISLIYVFGAMCGPAIIMAGPFLEIWIGREFAQSSRLVAEILLFGAWMNGIAFMPYSQLQAQGRPHITARVHAIEIVPFLLGLWLLIRLAGLPGAALAWSLRVGADCIALLWLAGCLRGILLRAIPGVTLMLLCFLLAEGLMAQPTVAFWLSVMLGLAFLGFGILLEPTLRDAAQMVAVKLIRASVRLRGERI
jgi:O-antigen/teichoic acid export membrane protein